MIKVLYFAALAEEVGCREELLECNYGNTQNLIEALRQRGEPWQSALARKQLMIAVNQVMSSQDSIINDGDEVALFPPVTGG